jgi:hypothetical protein
MIGAPFIGDFFEDGAVFSSDDTRLTGDACKANYI